MKILMVNKFFYIKGGSDTYYFALKRLLEEKGHTVVDFSMQDDRNFPSPNSGYFVSNADYNGARNPLDQAKAGLNIIYSLEAKRKFEQLVRDTRPDCVHLHIFQHQISPSILDVVRKYDLPTVYTAHELKMLCLNYKMMQHGKICEACRGGKYYHCAVNRCVKDSFVKSCVNVAEGYLHRWRKSYDVIDRIITPSAFYQKKFEEFGVSPDRVVHISNFLEGEKPEVNPIAGRPYYLYFGRLSEEKGIMTLLKAFRSLDVPLCLAGSGPCQEAAEQYIRQHRMDHVRMLGFKSGQELVDLIGNAKAVLLPSEWYENGPYSAIEALQLGRPILGADIGGIPELVEQNGYLFPSGNAEALAARVMEMEKLPEAAYHGMEQASLHLFAANHTAETHYQRLEQVYEAALDRHKRR